MKPAHVWTIGAAWFMGQAVALWPDGTIALGTLLAELSWLWLLASVLRRMRGTPPHLK